LNEQVNEQALLEAKKNLAEGKHIHSVEQAMALQAEEEKANKPS